MQFIVLFLLRGLYFICRLPWTALVAISPSWLDAALIKSCRHFSTFLSNFSQSWFQKHPKNFPFRVFFCSLIIQMAIAMALTWQGHHYWWFHLSIGLSKYVQNKGDTSDFFVFVFCNMVTFVCFKPFLCIRGQYWFSSPVYFICLLLTQNMLKTNTRRGDTSVFIVICFRAIFGCFKPFLFSSAYLRESFSLLLRKT